MTISDPLAVFNEIKSKRQQQIDDGPDYPGNIAPRNRSNGVVHTSHDWLNSLKATEYSVGGVVKRFYSIGALATALNRKPVTIRSWESKGWIPPASFRTPAPQGEQLPGKALKGRRLYSESQLVFLVEAAIAYAIDDPVKPDWAGFRKVIADNYPKH